MGFVLLLLHDLHGTRKRLSLTKGSANQVYNNNSDDATLNMNDRHVSIESKISEVSHIGFLKVHKAGGTTMLNMLFRFGLKRNLTFVIPKAKDIYINPNKTLPVKQGGHYDILAVHVDAFNKVMFDQLLPHDKVNIAIVREPLDRMISAAYYFRDVWRVPYLRSIPKEHFIENLVDYPEKYDKKDFSVTKNAMGKDFGFMVSLRESDIDKIQDRLEFLDKEFRLVLVLERFDESLVLLKRYLGWQMSDIMYRSTNTHQHALVNLTEKQKINNKYTCFLDYAIYDFFSKICADKVEAEGPGFKDEVSYFQGVLQQLEAFCSQPGTETNNLIVKASEWNTEFQVPKSDCELMLIEGLTFVERLRTRHKQMNKLSNSTGALF